MTLLLNLFAQVPGTTTPEMLEEYLQDLSQLKWYIVPLFVITIYIVCSEIEKKHYSVVFAAFAFWLVDVFNETWNSMVYATTGQPVWGVTAAGGTSLEILIGYNIEISFLFLIIGIVSCKWLKTTPGYEGEGFWGANKNWITDPNNMFYKYNVKRKDLSLDERKIKTKAILGRVIPAVTGSILAVIIEIILNKAGLLTWEKSWWQASVPYLIFLIGYCPFFFAAVIVHDLPRKKQFIVVGAILAVVVILLVISGSLGMLGKQIPEWRWLNS
ncbi:MAG: hypothetical protein H6687_02545 [Bacillales bacterium]|nr:hypothetical protein [Bacillales bacterium]